MSSVVSPVKPVSPARAESRVNIIEKTDEEIRAIAAPLWRDLVKYSNEGKYGEFVRNFSSSLALAMNQVVAGHQFSAAPRSRANGWAGLSSAMKTDR
jgi:hypothetical protein